MSQKTETVQTMLSLTGRGSAELSAITWIDPHVTIAIPSGKGGILTAVELSFIGTMETVVNNGGVVRLRNTSADWDPFWITTGTITSVTEGGAQLKPFVFQCRKFLPGNSTVYVSYAPYNDGAQRLEVTLHWILTEEYPEYETFVDLVHPLYADEVHATTRAAVVTSFFHNAADVIPIPGHKGGTLQSWYLMPWGTLETVVVTGGMVEAFCDAHDIEPMEAYTTMSTCVTGGGAAYNPMIIPHNHEVKANSNYRFMYTPRDDQLQTVTCGLVWTRPFIGKR